MSGGTWNYKNEWIAQFLVEGINDPEESSFYTDFPALSNVLFELGAALDEITHDLDWHYACDSQIQDMEKFEQEALKKLMEAMMSIRIQNLIDEIQPFSENMLIKVRDHQGQLVSVKNITYQFSGNMDEAVLVFEISDKHVSRVGWDGTTAQSCRVEDLDK